MAQYRRYLDSNKVHELDDAGRSHEACNLDDAGDFTVLYSLYGVDVTDLCKRCFPNGMPEDKEAVTIPTEGPIEATVTITTEDPPAEGREDY